MKISGVSAGDTSAIFETTKDWAVPAELGINIKVVKDNIYSSLTDDAIGGKKYIQMILGRKASEQNSFKDLRIYTDKGILRPISYAKLSDDCRDELIAYDKKNTTTAFKLFEIIFDYTSNFVKGGSSAISFTDKHSVEFDPSIHVKLEMIIQASYYTNKEMNFFYANGSHIYNANLYEPFEIFFLFRNSNIDAGNITKISFWNCSYDNYEVYIYNTYIKECRIALKSTANTIIWEVEGIENDFLDVPTYVEVDCKKEIISFMNYEQYLLKQYNYMTYEITNKNMFYMQFNSNENPFITAMVNLRLYLNNGDILTPMNITKKEITDIGLMENLQDEYKNLYELYEVVYSKNQGEVYPTKNPADTGISIDDNADYVKFLFLVQEQYCSTLILKKDTSSSFSQYISLKNFSKVPIYIYLIAFDNNEGRIGIDDIGKISMQNDIRNSDIAYVGSGYYYGFNLVVAKKYKDKQEVSSAILNFGTDSTLNRLNNLVEIDLQNAVITAKNTNGARFGDTSLAEKDQ